ncbi:MAG: aminopeptidase [Pseudomonadota bacterium]
MINRREPVAELLVDDAVPAALKERLRAVQAMRDFASAELGLPDNDSYRSYADLERRYVVWNVFAAPAYSVEPQQWCFVFVGCVTYRGYFREEKAQAFAADLKAEGLDAYVGGVAAYSTLGNFADPLLNTMLYNDDLGLAALLFHELSHQLLFVKGDTAFNESFATAVEEEGLRRWLVANGKPEDFAIYQQRKRRAADFAALIGAARENLRGVYAATGDDETAAAAKAAAFADLQADYESLKASWGGYAGYDAWFARDLNNAHLASVSAYRGLVPAFRVLLAQSNDDLAEFYRRVEALAALDRDERHAELAVLEAAAEKDPSGSGVSPR